MDEKSLHCAGLHEISDLLSSYPVLQAYTASKYAYFYFSPSQQSPARSTAAFLVSYLQYEQTEPQNRPLSAALPLPELLDWRPQGYFGTSAFEETAQVLVNAVEKCLEPYFPAESEPNYREICSDLQVCITVIRSEEGFACKETFWPANCTNSPYSHLTIMDFFPYPVLIPWKIVPFLSRNLPVPFQYRSKCRFSTAENEYTSMKAVETALGQQTQELLTFTGQLIGRFGELLGSGQLDCTFSSAELGASLRDLLGVSRALITVEPIHPAAIGTREAAVIDSMLANQALTRLSQPCSMPNCLEIRDAGLFCGHNYCSAHFVQLVEAARTKGKALVRADEDYTAVLCSLCRTPVSAICISNYSLDLYSRLVAEGEDHRGVAQCSVCALPRPNRMVGRPRCKHLICIICAQTSAKCCSQSTEEVSKWAQELVLSCDGCQGISPGVCCAPSPCEFSHILCPLCSFQSLKSAQCASCQLSISSFDLSLLRTKALGKCQVCKEKKGFEEFLDLPCSCLICNICGFKLALETNNCEVCWTDGTPFSAVLSDYIKEQSGLEKAPKCHFCEGKYPTPDLTLTCSHLVHSYCLILTASERLFAEPRAERIYCPCGIEVLGTIVPVQWPRPDHPRIKAFLEENSRQIEVHCKVCGDKDSGIYFSADYDQPIKNRCSHCNHLYCALCLEEWEGLHSQGACTHLTALQKVRSLEQKGSVAVQCPYCRLAQRQVSGWQECECKGFFCSECVARYDVIRVHGGSYHRPDCLMWTPEVLDSGFNENCSVCQMVGGDQACAPPRRLPRKGQFSPADLAYY